MTEVNFPLISLEEALDIIESIVANSQSDGVFVNLNAMESALSRFSGNQMTQNLSKNRFSFSITSHFGQKSASAGNTGVEPDAIQATLRRSEELARLVPDDPEWLPLLEPQQYDQNRAAFDNKTANSSPLERGQIIQKVCSQCDRSRVEGSGTLSNSASLLAIGSSTGLRGYSQNTRADFSMTSKYRNGSSWSNRTSFALADLPIENITEQVITRSIVSADPQEIAPGSYSVVLEPAAFVDLLPWVIYNLDARSADEGRSFMSRLDSEGKPNGNFIGESLFSPIVQVAREPSHPLLQLANFSEDGLPRHTLDIISSGIPQTLGYSRYWATKQKKDPTGSLFPLVMRGSSKTVQDLIAQTERGIFISRAWYVRSVNPRTLEVTGMTRDGTFWIENGKIAYPIKNLRFNQELPTMLKDIEDVSRAERFGNSVVPGVKIKNFHFSSVTDSI